MFETEEEIRPITVKNGKWQVLGSTFQDMTQEEKNLLSLHINLKKERYGNVPS